MVRRKEKVKALVKGWKTRRVIEMSQMKEVVRAEKDKHVRMQLVRQFILYVESAKFQMLPLEEPS